jgi:putative addiction module CopG family antidote
LLFCSCFASIVPQVQEGLQAMNDMTITVSISRRERQFIADQMASGKYAGEEEILRAGLAALEREAKLLELRAMMAEGEDDVELGKSPIFNEPDDLGKCIADNARQIKLALEASEASGESARSVPQIMQAVKSKLRANGSI